MTMSVYPGSARFVTRQGDRVTHHSFSFGEHYDPYNVGFGPLVAHNDDLLSWGAGYPTHRHLDVEIVTWVLRGTLVHTDSLGNTSRLPAGTVQVQSAGSGIEHSEVADTEDAPVRFVQCWLRPDQPGLPPARFVASGVADGAEGLVPVAGAAGGLPVGTAGATLWVGRLAPGSRHLLPAAPRHHVFVATGGGSLGSVDGAGDPPDGPADAPAGGHADEPADGGAASLTGGDAVRVEGERGPEFRTGAEETELVVWTLPADETGL